MKWKIYFIPFPSHFTLFCSALFHFIPSIQTLIYLLANREYIFLSFSVWKNHCMRQFHGPSPHPHPHNQNVRRIFCCRPHLIRVYFAVLTYKTRPFKLLHISWYKLIYFSSLVLKCIKAPQIIATFFLYWYGNYYYQLQYFIQTTKKKRKYTWLQSYYPMIINTLYNNKNVTFLATNSISIDRNVEIAR
jgi:hypothetical protein